MLSQGRFFSLFRDQRFEEAAALLAKDAEKEGRDQILFQLDMGLALFEAGKYKDAIDILTKAEQLSENKDYTSVSEEVISVVSTDKYKQFRPLDFERILINVYLALSYTMLGKNEDALVECRRINNLVYNLKNKGMKDFEEIPVAWYISAMLYEMRKKYNDALIDYERTKKLEPGFKFAAEDVSRMKKRLRGFRHSDTCGNCGEVIIVFSSGLIPVKRVDPSNRMLPKFYGRGGDPGYLEILDEFNTYKTRSYQILDLENVAIKNLESRKSRIIAKRLLGTATQVGVGYGVAKATKSDTLGVLAGVLLHSTSEPDLRSWSTLPKSMQIARLEMTEGDHELTLKHFGTEVKRKVSVKKDGISFVVLREF